MKPHSAEFKNAIKQMGRELRGVITYGSTTLEEEIMSITPHYEANILKSVMKQLDLELSVDIPLETVINCQIGILVDEEYEMLNFGNYVVYSSEKQEDTNTYKIVCYDKLLYSMKQNEDLGVTYPISIKNYLTALATKIGLTVASGTFYNSSLQIPSELYVGLEYTYRDILDEIAQATGSIITLNNNDEIEVRYPNDLGSTATVNGTNLTIAEHSNNIIVNAIISGNSIQDGTPTPANPVEIETAGDQINYFNKDTILAGHLINSNGTITEDSYNFVSDYIEVDSDREYTISAVTNKAKRIAYYNSEQTFISRPVVSNYSGTVTTPSNAKYVRLSCHNDDLNSLQFYNTIGEIPLTISNSDNTQSQEFTISCQQPMRSIGNVRDVFVKQDGVWYEKHNLGEVILNGTETWYMTNDGNFKRFSTLINTLEQFAGRKSNLLSNYFVGNTTGAIGNMYSYDKYVYLYPTSDITSIDSFKAWLSSNNTKIVYVLGTPNYIQCTDEQIQVLNAISHSSLYTGVTNINSDAYLSITYNSASESIDEEYLKDVNVDFAEMYGPVNSIVLSRAGGSDNVYIRDEESVQENGLCEVKIADNQLMNFNNRSDYLAGLLAALDGLSYYKNDFNSTGIMYYDVGDLYNVQIGENTYQCLMLNDEINVTTGIEERIYTDLPEQSQTDYSKADKTDRRINQTYLIVDKQNQTIESVVSNVSSQNTKISQITQTVDELNSKISDIADITKAGESTNGIVSLTEINSSEPIMIKIRPNNSGDTMRISYIYPSDGIFPNDTGGGGKWYMPNRLIQFKRTYIEDDVTKTEYIYYEIPDDLLFYNSTYYDEFYLDYDSHTCQVIKRCKYDSFGYIVSATETVTDYPYPEILLQDGDYEISLISREWTSGSGWNYLFVRLMAQNIYTTQFTTHTEVTSAISQKADEIDLSVNQKLSNYSTTNEMNSAINIKADQITSTVSQTYATKNETNSLSSRIKQTAKSIELTTSDNGTSAGITIRVRNEDGSQIDSDTGNITLSGLVKFTDLSRSGSTTINGSNITTGTIDASRVNVTNINANNIESGTISGSKISGGTIDGDKVTIKNLDASKITTGTLSASKISGGTLNADNMTVKNLTADSIKSKTLNGISLKSSSISGGAVSGSAISNSGYRFQGDNNESVSINKSQTGAIEGYYSGGRRYALVAFTAGGKFQTWDNTGAMRSYFDQQGAHTSSDIRLKDNITNIDEKVSFNIINKLTPIEFTFKDSENKYHRGLSAQEIKNVLDECEIKDQIYSKNNDGYYTLSYTELIPDLINCIKYLTKEIEKLKGGK